MSTVVQHRPVNANEKERSVECICGEKFLGKSLDEAWDNYDEHTME